MKSVARGGLLSIVCWLIFCPATHGKAAVTLFEQTFTGEALADEVAAGQASYPGSPTVALSGTRLDLTNEFTYSILYRMPFLSAGSLNGYRDLSISIDTDYAQLTSDNDLGIAVSDGTCVLGVMMGDQGVAWALDGLDAGTTYAGDYLPSESFPDDLPLNILIEAGDLPDTSRVTIGNSTGGSLVFAGLAGIDYGREIHFVLVGDDTDEQYGVSSVHIRAEAIPIPVPGAFLLGTVGFGLVGWLRRRRTL